jgi:hypothetical protein
MARSLVSLALALCFAFNAMALGGGPACSVMDGTSSQAHAGHHRHGGGPGHLPGAAHCVVHLCCAHASPLASVRLIKSRYVIPADRLGSFPAVTILIERAPHFLPFAQAPPRTIT